MNLPRLLATPQPEWRRLWRLAAPHRRPLLLAMLLLVGSSLIGLAVPWSIRWLVDTVFVTNDLAQLDAVAAGLFGLFMLQSVLAIGYQYVISRVGQRLVADLRLRIYTHVQRLPLRFFAERRTGEIVSRISNDVTVVQEVITETPINLLQQTVTLIGGLALMFVMNWRLALLVLLLVPPLVIVAVLFGRRLQRISTNVQDLLADATVTLEEMLSGIRVVKSFVREDHERARFAGQVENAYAAAIGRARVQAIFGQTLSLFGFGALTLLLWYGGRQVVQGTLTPGELIAFLFYMLMVAGPLGNFAQLYGRLRGALGGGARLFELLDATPEPCASSTTSRAAALQGNLRFEGVQWDPLESTCRHASLSIL